VMPQGMGIDSWMRSSLSSWENRRTARRGAFRAP
jgi:hypothetical protein